MILGPPLETPYANYACICVLRFVYVVCVVRM